MIKKYTNFKLDEANTQAKGLEIKNEYTKLINDPTLNTLDLGTVDDVSDADITNIQQTYKESIVKSVDGHYILIIKEGTVIHFSDFGRMDEGFFDVMSTFNPEKELKNILSVLSESDFNVLAKYENRNLFINALQTEGVTIETNDFQRIVNKMLNESDHKQFDYFAGDKGDVKLSKEDISIMNKIVDVIPMIRDL